MKNLFLLLLLFTLLPAAAQKGRFNKGLVVTSSGDTLYGYISWKKNPGSRDSLYFKNNEKKDEVSFAWSSLTYFCPSDGEERIVCTIKRNLEYIDPYTYNIMLQDSTISEAIPLTVVYKGKHLSLYKYYGPADYYFISDGIKVVQLVQTYRYLTSTETYFYQSRVPRYIINYIYRYMLFEFYDFDSDRKMNGLLESTEFTEISLKNLISKMDKRLK